MNRRAFTIALIGLAGCTGGEVDESDDDDGQQIEVHEHEWTVVEEFDHAQDHYGVELVAQNVTSDQLEVFCTARFLDEDGVQIGDSTRSVSGVPPDGKFEMTLTYVEDEPDRVAEYKLDFEVYRV